MATIVDKLTLRVVTRSGNTPDYPTADYLINPAGLAAVEAVPEKYRKLNGEDVAEMTTAEKTAVDDAAGALNAEKALRIAAIDARTEVLVEQGFEYPASSGNIFSLTPGARENWAGLAEADDRSLLTYPQVVGTTDFEDYSIADATAFGSFYATALGTVKYHREAGQALRKQIRDATTRAAVDAVVDSR